MASLTKSQLINELVNHGVKPPSPGVKKEKLVQMYEKHVAPIQDAAGEFSSDDEAIGKQMNGDEGSVSSLSTDITDLDNEELTRQLRSHGVKVGPIVATTRRLYEKKLARLLGAEPAAGGGLTRRSAVTSYSTRTVTVTNGSAAEYSDSEEEEEPATRATRSGDGDGVRHRPTAPLTTSSTVTGSAASGGGGGAELNHSSPSLQPVFLRDESDQPTPRRAVHDVRGSYPRDQYITRTHATNYTSAADVADGRYDLTAKSGAGSRGWVRALVRLCVLLVLIAAAYYCYNHYNEAPSFEEMQKAARDAVNKAAEKVDSLRKKA